MDPRGPTTRFLALLVLACGCTCAQVALSGRVVDETGAAVVGARVELRPSDGGAAVVASSDRAGNFKLTLPSTGDYDIRAERLGFFLHQQRSQPFEMEATELTITLNHRQEFSEHIDVTSSAPAIDPQQPADRKELDNTEILTVPYPAPHDYRSALPLIDGVVQDNLGRSHFNGGQVHQTSYSLNGFNIADPATGRLETRVNIETIQSMEVQTSRFSAENGRGSAGILDLKTKMGDDRWRFGGTNFIPGVSTDDGVYVNKWTPRLEVSGPLVKGRAWFHNGFDAFYSNDVVPGLPAGENRTTGLTSSNLTRFQVNITPGNLMTGSFLYNFADTNRLGLSFVNPNESTTDRNQVLYMSTLRNQQYFGNGALLEVGFADSRGLLRDLPLGDSLFRITPLGNQGNYFVSMDRRFYRQQGIANLFLPTVNRYGRHQLKFGIDIEREAFHQRVGRHDYEVIRADSSVARRVTFVGNPFQARKNLEAAQYIQDSWTIHDGLLIEAGFRTEWNEIVRDLAIAPRLAAAWAPKRLGNTKFSAGWGIYLDAIRLETMARHQDQMNLSTFYAPGGGVRGPVTSQFVVNDHELVMPRYQTVSVSIEHKLPREFYLKSGYLRRTGSRGFTFLPAAPPAGNVFYDGAAFHLTNSRRERYDAFEVSVRHTFAGKYEWFAGYTRSSARTNAAVDYSIENPVFAFQAPGPFAWDTPNRFHMWGWAPLPNKILLPKMSEFVTRNTSAAYLVEYRTGFPFGVVDEEGFLVGRPNSRRYPDYFNVNIHIERQFRALHYLWAWRFGINNVTNNGNPNAVNNVMGTPHFLVYNRGQNRAFTVRLRFFGRK